MMEEFEKWLARVLVLNSGLTFGVCLGLLGTPQPAADLPWLYGAALLGLVSGLLALRGKALGWAGALLYYGAQVLSYYPLGPQGGTGWSLKAGLSIGWVLQFASAVLVINLLALVLLAASGWMLWRRRHSRN